MWRDSGERGVSKEMVKSYGYAMLPLTMEESSTRLVFASLPRSVASNATTR